MSSLAETFRARSWRGRTRALRLLLLLILPLAAVLAGTAWYLASGRYVSTDDAYVEADIVQVSSDVPGRVVAIAVHDNQQVKTGQVLYRLDDRAYRIAVEQAQAALADTRLQIDRLRATYRQKLAELQAARDTLAFEQREFERQQNLVAAHVASQAQLDRARNNFDNARQRVASAQEQIANILASLGGNPDTPTEQHPLVRQAQARLDQAELDLSHTVVTASCNGIVTKVDKLAVGDYLEAATPAFSLVGTDRLWIEANFKETQLTHIEPGQSTTVTVDTYPGETLTGRVASFSPGTGSQFSLLPAQNATGNWVKVVQRLPVRIALDDASTARALRAGMSADVEIDTHRQNPLLSSLASFIGEAHAAHER